VSVAGGAVLARWLGVQTRYEVLVRSDDGIDRAFSVDAPPALKQGATVRVVDGVLQRSPGAVRHDAWRAARRWGAAHAPPLQAGPNSGWMTGPLEVCRMSA
jgi:hypothetical protein